MARRSRGARLARGATLGAGLVLCAGGALAASAGARPARAARAAATETAPTVRTYRTRPDIKVPVIGVKMRRSGRAPGYVALAPKGPAGGPGVMLADDRGRTVWFGPMQPGRLATDFRVQSYRGRPVLTWWEGKFVPPGSGEGYGVIYDDHYHLLKRVYAGNGLQMDLHEFRLTAAGTALVIDYHAVHRDLSSVGGARRGTAIDGIVQEIDVATGKVRFEWHTLGHIAFDESSLSAPHDKSPYDYAHLNSVDQEPNGDLLVSARNTSTVYEIDRATGNVVWRLGGKRSSFHMGTGAKFALQHDARRQADGTVTLFDNGRRNHSRALRLALDTTAMTATVVRELRHSADVFANSQGDAQAEPGGGVFVGWGATGVFSEFDPAGTLVFDAALPAGEDTYRAYRVQWTGRPASRPAVLGRVRKGAMTVYASWNGATGVATWRVLGGASPTKLAVAGSGPKWAFETPIRVAHPARYVAVEALDAGGKVLGRSDTVAVR